MNSRNNHIGKIWIIDGFGTMGACIYELDLGIVFFKLPHQKGF